MTKKKATQPDSTKTLATIMVDVAKAKSTIAVLLARVESLEAEVSMLRRRRGLLARLFGRR